MSMPKAYEERLQQLNDPDKIKYFQDKWNEYVTANAHYERVYPQQFESLAYGNRAFGEQKTIETPAEQMHRYREMFEAELVENIEEKTAGREEIYEEPDHTPEEEKVHDSRRQRMEDFQATFESMETPQEPAQGQGTGKDKDDLDRSLEAAFPWLAEPEAGGPAEGKEAPKDLPQAQYDIEVNLWSFDGPDKEDTDIEPEAPGMDDYTDD